MHWRLVCCFIVLIALSSGCNADTGPMPVQSISRITIDIGNISHPVKGFGAHIWAGDMDVEPILRELRMRYVRLTVGPNWFNVKNTPPTDSTREEMDRFLINNFDGDGEPRLKNMKNTWQMVQRLGLETIMIQFTAPDNWLSQDGQRRLLPQHLDDYARYWGSLLILMRQHGIMPTYIELVNEPEGDWCTRIPPEEYNRLVILTRKELDDRGFEHVGIVGPGLAWLDHDGGGKRWVEALTQDGLDALAGWSTHVWDDKFQPDADVQFVADKWTRFRDAVRRKDPKWTRPILVTEYATGAHVFYGIAYDPVESNGNNRASDSHPYAIRVFEQTLVHINRGASVLIVWEARDQLWSHHAWGLSTSNGERRPAFYALRTLLPHIPTDAMALKKTWPDSPVRVAGFVNNERLTLALANGSTYTQQRVIELKQARHLMLLGGLRYSESGTDHIPPRLTGKHIRVTLPPLSTLTCTLALVPDKDAP